jgi:hypothetical protein
LQEKEDKMSTGSCRNSKEHRESLKIATYKLSGGNAGAFAGYWQNPEQAPALILDMVVKVIVPGGIDGGEIDTGTAATPVTHSANLIDGAKGNHVGFKDNIVGGGVNGKGAQLLDAKGGALSYITTQIIKQSEINLIGIVYITYILLG